MRDFACPNCGGKTFSASADLFLLSEVDRYNSNSELACRKCGHKGPAKDFVHTVKKGENKNAR